MAELMLSRSRFKNSFDSLRSFNSVFSIIIPIYLKFDPHRLDQQNKYDPQKIKEGLKSCACPTLWRP
jgi:hypothetical protein